MGRLDVDTDVQIIAPNNGLLSIRFYDKDGKRYALGVQLGGLALYDFTAGNYVWENH